MLHTIPLCGTESCQSKETREICLPSYRSFQSARVMPHDVITLENLYLKQCDQSETTWIMLSSNNALDIAACSLDSLQTLRCIESSLRHCTHPYTTFRKQ